MTEKIVRLETQAREGREIEVLLATAGYARWQDDRQKQLLNSISDASDDSELTLAAHDLRAFLKFTNGLKQLVTEGNQAAKDLEKRR